MFYNGDAVTFDTTGLIKNITVAAAGVQVAAMSVTGGAYTFTGGPITSTTITTLPAAENTQRLDISNATVTLNASTLFANGVTLTTGTLVNNATLANTSTHGILVNAGGPSAITNTAHISATGAANSSGINANGATTPLTLTNSGLIEAGFRGVALNGAGSQVTNSGTIIGGLAALGAGIYAGVPVTITNAATGYITGNNNALSLEPRLALAALHEKRNNAAAAGNTYIEAASKITNATITVLYKAAEAAIAQKRYDLAAEFASRGLASAPGDYRFFYQMAVARAYQNRRPDARAYAEHCALLAPDPAFANRVKAWAADL